MKLYIKEFYKPVPAQYTHWIRYTTPDINTISFSDNIRCYSGDIRYYTTATTGSNWATYNPILTNGVVRSIGDGGTQN